MADEPNVGEDLFSFAQVLVRELLKKYGLRWDSHRIEDAEQELFLAGWQVWCDTQNAGLAKNRMASRQKNLLRDFCSEKKHEPKAASRHLDEPGGDKTGKHWDEDAVRDRQNASSLARIRDDPAVNVAFEEYLERMPDRRRQIALLRWAGYSDREIADEVGVSLRTVERELSELRREHEDEERS